MRLSVLRRNLTNDKKMFINLEKTYNYLQNTKNANIVYPVCFAVEENRYKGDIYIHRVTNGTIMAWPWGYDN
jgi:hypothetical protein